MMASRFLVEFPRNECLKWAALLLLTLVDYWCLSGRFAAGSKLLKQIGKQLSVASQRIQRGRHGNRQEELVPLFWAFNGHSFQPCFAVAQQKAFLEA